MPDSPEELDEHDGTEPAGRTFAHGTWLALGLSGRPKQAPEAPKSAKSSLV